MLAFAARKDTIMENIDLSGLHYAQLCALLSFNQIKVFLLDPTGLLTAVHKDFFRVLNCRELHFNDCGDRVAQLLHVELATPFSQCRNNDIRQEILIVNTHLLFPHDASLCLVRLHQVYSFFPSSSHSLLFRNLNCFIAHSLLVTTVGVFS